jgi:hypothetical protein
MLGSSPRIVIGRRMQLDDTNQSRLVPRRRSDLLYLRYWKSLHLKPVSIVVLLWLREGNLMESVEVVCADVEPRRHPPALLPMIFHPTLKTMNAKH